jgi:hypothetical protein
MDFSVADAIIFPALTTSIFPVPLFHSWRRLRTGFLACASADAVGCGKAWRCTGAATNAYPKDPHCGDPLATLARWSLSVDDWGRSVSSGLSGKHIFVVPFTFPITAHIFRCSYQATRISFLGMRGQAHQDMPSVQATRHRRQNALALPLDVSSAQQAVRAVKNPPIMNFSVST